MNRFIIDHAGNPDALAVIKNACRFISELPKSKKWEIVIKPYRLNRSNSQNAYLWGVVYKTIADEDAGVFFSDAVEAQIAQSTLKREDVIHEFCKAKFLPALDVNGVKITPSTAKLKTDAFTEYVEHIMRFASTTLGIYIPTPADKNLADYEKWWGR